MGAKDDEKRIAKEFAELHSGNLLVTIHEAKSLPKVQKIGKQDPFGKAKYGKKSFATCVAMNTLDPNWEDADGDGKKDDTHFKFTIGGKAKPIVFEVVNKNMIKNTIIGTASIPYDKIITLTGKTSELWLDLSRKGKKTDGKVRVSLHFVPHAIESLTKKQIDEFKLAFDQFDTDKSGSISPEELLGALSKLGKEVTKQEVDDMIKLIDADQNGSVEFEEFLLLLARQQENAATDAQLKKTFDQFDEDGNGFITVEELQKVMGKLGEELTLEEAKQMISDSDEDDDGKIDFKEFKNMMRGM